MMKKTQDSIRVLTEFWVEARFGYKNEQGIWKMNSRDIELALLPYINKMRGYVEKRPISSESVFRRFRQMVSLSQFKKLTVTPEKGPSGERFWVISEKE